jgi:hypothetical protein
LDALRRFDRHNLSTIAAAQFDARAREYLSKHLTTTGLSIPIPKPIVGSVPQLLLLDLARVTHLILYTKTRWV